MTDTTESIPMTTDQTDESLGDKPVRELSGGVRPSFSPKKPPKSSLWQRLFSSNHRGNADNDEEAPKKNTVNWGPTGQLGIQLSVAFREIGRLLLWLGRWIYYRIYVALRWSGEQLQEAPVPHQQQVDQERFDKKMALYLRLVDEYPSFVLALLNGKSGGKSSLGSVLAMFITTWTLRLVAFCIWNPGVAADAEEFAGVHNRHERAKRTWLKWLTPSEIARRIGIATGDLGDVAELLFGRTQNSYSWDTPKGVDITEFQGVIPPNTTGTHVITNAATTRDRPRFDYSGKAMKALFWAVKRLMSIMVVDTGNKPDDPWTLELLEQLGHGDEIGKGGQALIVAEALSSPRGRGSLTDARTTLADIRAVIDEDSHSMRVLKDAIVVVVGMQDEDDLEEMIADYFPDLNELGLDEIEFMTVPFDNEIRKEGKPFQKSSRHRFYDTNKLALATTEAHLDIAIRSAQMLIVRRDGQLPGHLTLEYTLAT